MRRVNIDSVVYFSNEDPANPASNLLDPGVGNKKWLCCPGEPFCSVVLQLARAVQISAVYIGAMQAGFIEVQVGRSETPTVPCEVLLPRVEFVSYTASRANSSGPQEATFSAGQLMRDTRDKSWDRVRVVCSQPYNPRYKYGLSFIEIFEDEDRNNPDAQGPPPPSRMMALLDASEADDYSLLHRYARQPWRLNIGATRNNHGPRRPQVPPPVGNRAAPRAPVRAPPRVPPGIPPGPAPLAPVRAPPGVAPRVARRVARRVVRKVKTVGKVVKKRTKKISYRRKKTRFTTKSNRQKRTPMHTDNNEQPSTSESVGESSNPRGSRGKTDSKDENKTKRTPKGKAVRASQRRLLSAVVFALSGYSPARGARLRAAAEALGASFQAAWSPRCTHLICAGSAVPELKALRAARAACIAVHGEWLERCGARGRRLPWQWFATERAHRLPPGSHAEG